MLHSDGLGLRWWTLIGAVPFALDFDRGVISRVVPSSPAEHAGLHTGDSVEAIDGRPVRTLLALPPL
jgi:S1-C subfamily serine protease